MGLSRSRFELMSIEQQVTLLTRDANRTADEVETLRAEINARFDALERRFDERFDGLEQRFSRLETDVRQIIDLLQRNSQS